MRDVVDEAYELVEDGLMTGDDFRDFTFTNPLRFFTDLNPRLLRRHRHRGRGQGGPRPSSSNLSPAGGAP